MAKKSIDPFYRRKRRDGTIEETWTVDKTYRGVRINRSSGLSNKKEARKWLAEQIEEVDRRLVSQPSTKGLKRYNLEDAFLEYWQKKLQFSRSAKVDGFILKKLLTQFPQKMRIEDLSTAMVADWIALRKTSGLAPASINRYMSILRAAHTYMRDVMEYPVRTIAWKKLSQRVPERVKTTPTPEEVDALIAAAHPKLAPAIKFAAITGLRWHEVYGLDWSSIDLDSRQMIVLGKGDKEVLLPLSSVATSLLSSIPRGSSSRVFDPTNFRPRWNAARIAAGVHIRFHDLRHAFATWLDQMGAPVQDIKQSMRHSNIATSLIYVDAKGRKLLPYLEKVGSLLNSDVSPASLTSVSRLKRIRKLRG